MNLADGYGAIEHGDDVYSVSPSFVNIAKIGKPSDIIRKAADVFQYEDDLIKAHLSAMDICEACGVPRFLMGGVNISGWTGKAVIRPGEMEPRMVIVVAMHLIKHGITGVASSFVSSKKSPASSGFVSEFDPSEYIVIAKEFLDLTLEEAESLTMTKFLRLSGAKLELEERRALKAKGVPDKAEISHNMSVHDKLRADMQRLREHKKRSKS